MRLDAGLRPGMARLTRDAGATEQFQFGIRRIWLDGLETYTEACEIVAMRAVAIRGAVVAAQLNAGSSRR